jgi:hypothetical protein
MASFPFVPVDAPALAADQAAGTAVVAAHPSVASFATTQREILMRECSALPPLPRGNKGGERGQEGEEKGGRHRIPPDLLSRTRRRGRLCLDRVLSVFSPSFSSPLIPSMALSICVVRLVGGKVHEQPLMYLCCLSAGCSLPPQGGGGGEHHTLCMEEDPSLAVFSDLAALSLSASRLSPYTPRSFFIVVLCAGDLAG